MAGLLDQGELDFTRTHARTGDPQTCFDAAESQARTASENCAAVLEFVASCGDRGATHKDVIAHFGGNRSMRRRLSDNVVAGHVIPNGKRRDGCNVYITQEA